MQFQATGHKTVTANRRILVFQQKFNAPNFLALCFSLFVGIKKSLPTHTIRTMDKTLCTVYSIVLLCSSL